MGEGPLPSEREECRIALGQRCHTLTLVTVIVALLSASFILSLSSDQIDRQYPESPSESKISSRNKLYEEVFGSPGGPLLSMESDFSVLVIGGGMSGLAAAQTLLKQQTESSTIDVTVLEAKDRLGGRLHSVDMSLGNDDSGNPILFPVDLGGMYWHGESDVWKLVQLEYPRAAKMVPAGGDSSFPGKGRAKWLMRRKNSTDWSNAINGDQTDSMTGAMTWQEMTVQEQEAAQALFTNWRLAMEDHYQRYFRENQQGEGGGSGACAELIRNYKVNLASGSSSLLECWSDSFLDSLPSDMHRDWVRFSMFMAFELDSGVPFTDHDVKGMLNNWDWVDYAGGDYVAADSMGALVRAVADDIEASGARIQTGHRVQMVEHNAGGCRVLVTNTSQVAAREQEQVMSSMNADACIVAVPLGVLKEKATSMFVPPLPASKQDALERSGLGVMNTVVVQWKFPVCQPDVSAYYLVHRENGGYQDETGKENPLKHGFVCPGMLRGQKSDERTRAITQFHLSDSRLHSFGNITYWKEKAVEVMRELVPSVIPLPSTEVSSNSGKGLIELEDISVLKISKWHLDPDFRGTYSAPTSGTRGNADRQLLAIPIGRSLYFAGEHTHMSGRYQSIDGAYETGVRAAQEAIQDRVLITDEHNRRERKSLTISSISQRSECREDEEQCISQRVVIPTSTSSV